MSTAPSRPRYTGSIRWVDDMRPPIDKGIVLIAGSKATIYDRATGDGRKPAQVDVMRGVEFSEDGTQIRLKGQSLFAFRTMQLDESNSQVEVVVDLTGCKNC